MRRAFCGCLALLLLLPLSGCWSYRGLDELTIVTGIAIDKDPTKGVYQLTFEFVDTSTPTKEKGYTAKLVQSEGENLFAAVRDAKRRLGNKLYFGHDQIVILSKDLAEQEIIVDVVDWLMRDAECRETLFVAISQEKTAKEILEADGIGQSLLGHKLQQIIRKDDMVTSSTLRVELYQLYEIASSPGQELAVPAIHLVENEGAPASEINGLAVFKTEKLVGFLTPEETKYYLFAVNAFQKGVLTVQNPGKTHKSALEVFDSKTKIDFTVENGTIKITLRPKIIAALDEYATYEVSLDTAKLNEIKALAQRDLAEQISAVVRKVQTELGSDILEFGNLIYRRNYPLWKTIEDRWDALFPTVEVEVLVEVELINSAMLNKG